jgi:hypothetical protein
MVDWKRALKILENYSVGITHDRHFEDIQPYQHRKRFTFYLLVIGLAEIIWVVLLFCGLSFEVTLLVVGIPLFIFFLRAEELVPERFLKGTHRATVKTVADSSKRIFESLPFLVGNLPSMHLSPIGALGSDEATVNNTGELEGDVRVIQLSKLFDSEILETHLPWAGQALHLVKSAGEPPESGTIYIGAVDTHEEVRNQHGVLRVILIAPGSKQMELHLRALRTSGTFEGECLTDDWSKYTLKASISDEDEFHRSTLSD